MDPNLDLERQMADVWAQAKYEVMQEHRARGEHVFLDVQPHMNLETLRELRAKGCQLFPHEERLLWSGETVYPARSESVCG